MIEFEPAPAIAHLLRHPFRPPTAAPADVVSLAIGEPDFPTPEPIVVAAELALRTGHTHYGDWLGDPQLREVVAEVATKSAAVRYGPEHTVIGHGSTAIVTSAVLAIVRPGDRVLICEPAYSLYEECVRLAGGVPVLIAPRADFHLDIDLIAGQLTGARLLVTCSPSNPTGAVSTAEELTALADLVAGTGTWVLSDEAYCDLVYEPYVFTPGWAIPALTERLITCRTLSKGYAMTGWRVGYALAPEPVARAMRQVHRTINGPLNTAVQRAAITAIAGGASLVEPMLAEYRRRRGYVIERIGATPGLSAHEPEGAFYAFVRYDAPLASVDLAARLLAAGVAVQPGRRFGPSGEGHLRLSFATDQRSIEIGLDRIAAVLASLPDTGVVHE